MQHCQGSRQDAALGLKTLSIKIYNPPLVAETMALGELRMYA